MWSLPQGVDFLFGFIPDPRIDHVFSEDIPPQQEFVVSSQCFERFFKRRRGFWHILQFFWGQVVNILIEWTARIDSPLNAINRLSRLTKML